MSIMHSYVIPSALTKPLNQERLPVEGGGGGGRERTTHIITQGTV